MRASLCFSFLLPSLLFVNAQDSSTSLSSSTTTTLTPAQASAMAASSASSYWQALATSTPLQVGGDPVPGDAGSSGETSNSAGASGADNGSFGQLSRGGLIAIVVVVALVVIFGIVSSVLFYLAKKRSWEVRATIRRSARRVATALTPRRSQFPKGVMETGGRTSRGRTRLDDVPPTPKIASHFDLEKNNSNFSSIEMKQNKFSQKWARRTDK